MVALFPITHFREVMVVPEADREKFLALALEKSLTHRQLAAEISGTVERRQRGGRTAVMPKTPNQGMQQLSNYSDQMLQRQKLWDEAIFDSLDKISSSDCSDTLLDKVSKLREQQAELALAAQHNVERADAVVRRVKRILGAVFAEETEDTEDADEARPKFNKTPALRRAKASVKAARRTTGRAVARA